MKNEYGFEIDDTGDERIGKYFLYTDDYDELTVVVQYIGRNTSKNSACFKHISGNRLFFYRDHNLKIFFTNYGVIDILKLADWVDTDLWKAINRE